MGAVFDIQQIFTERAPALRRRLPPGSFALLRAVLHQERINRELRSLPRENAGELCKEALRRLGMKLRVVGVEHLQAAQRPVIAANHPSGGIDGFALMAGLAQRFPSFKLPANEILKAVPALEPHIVPIDRYRGNAGVVSAFEQAFVGDDCIVVFPAGRTARMRGGKLREYPWAKSFVTYARRHDREICPVHISGMNSAHFYRIHHLRSLLGIQINLEMFLLADELFRRRGETVELIIGGPRRPDSRNLQEDAELAAELRRETMDLGARRSILPIEGKTHG